MPMVENFHKDQCGKSELSCEELKKHLDSKHPIGHIDKQNDIAYYLLYLVSDEAKFVAGNEQITDGG